MTELQAGTQLDRFVIERLVARSGMASIYRAHDIDTGVSVALKIPHPEMESDPVLFDRFQREEKIGEQLNHPGVMKVLPNPGRTKLYMVLEWVEGRLLREIMAEQGRLPTERAITIAVRISDALEYIHKAGVAHRDLKPENIMVDDQDHIKLIDFGIASHAGSRRLTFAKLSLTMGTPEYISPEQVKGNRGDGRSDIYSLGVIFYEMLTGATPFPGTNPFVVMNERLLNHPVPPREVTPEISPEIQEVIYRALERDPRNRYSHARDFAWDLEHLHEVGVAERAELTNWKKRREPRVRQVLFYSLVALIPLAIFALLLLVARK